ncbi:BTB/POZ domain-containing protein npy5 [Phtheirospermum japonicum]|uniref:BTB/POZ domain-containing protein npy5 n=1 Tax=Phtheirospermum japonicum TaxID=374723 RepID=A0A830B1X3_9LAMI|nr:BTB/POZ domain-containing protein npy5 [Phtheirospermum japonicum]
MAANIIGESLKAYTLKRVPFFTIKGNDVTKYSYVVETIISLLPTQKNCVSCGFLIKLLQASIFFECGEMGRAELMRRIAGQLDEASVGDLMIRSSNGDMTSVCDVDVVRELVERFAMREHGDGMDGYSDVSKGKVGRLVDGYLAEAARDSTLTLSKFVGLAEMVSGYPRASHDGIYRAVDMYLKEHPSLTKSEKKRICRLMDCKKLSAAACAHAVQNERLPLRVVVQVLFFEQARAAGSSTPDLPGPVRSLLPRGSYGSSATTTTSDEDWDGDRTSEELKAELASLRLGNNKGGVDSADKVTAKKVKKMFSRLWSNKERQGETSESDTSASTSGEIKDATVVSGRTTNSRTQKKLLEAK